MKDLLTGLLFLTVGAIFGISSWQLSVGTSDEMGPGYFPLLISSVLVVVGMILIVKHLWKS
jgi:putative tricarboxylic transport membrane protein